MSKEQYQPTPDEIKKAEDMMTSEQKKQSEERAATIQHGYKEGVLKGYEFGNTEYSKYAESLRKSGDKRVEEKK